MAETPNTEILSKILSDLDLLIEEQTKGKDNKKSGNNGNVTLKIEGHDDVVALLTGLGALNKSQKKTFGDMADAIKSLASGLSQLKDVKLDKKSLEGLDPLIKFMMGISTLADGKAVKSGLKSFKKIFSNSVLKHIKKFLTGLSDIEADDSFKNSAKIINSMTWMVINLGLNDKAIDKGIKAIYKLANVDSESIKLLGLFTFYLTYYLPNDLKELNFKLKQLGYLLNALNIVKDMPFVALFALSILGKILNPENGEKVGLFLAKFITPIAEIDEKKVTAASKVISSMSKMLMSITVAIGVLTLLVMLDIKSLMIGVGLVFGIMVGLIGITYLLSISKIFIKGGLKALDDITSATLKMSLAIGVMSLLVTLFDANTILAGTGIVLAIFGTILLLVKFLNQDQKDIEAGLDSLSAISKCVFMITGAIGVMALLITIFDYTKIIIGTVIVVGILTLLMFIASKFGEKTEEIKAGTKGMYHLALATLLITATIGIMALLIDTYDIWTLIGGTLIVIGVITAITFLFKWIAQSDKDVKSGGDVMVMLALATLITAGTIALMCWIIKENPIMTIIGATLLVIGILTAMVGLFKWIANSNSDDSFKNSLIAIGVLTLILLAVALITKFILVPIGEQAKEAFFGALVVLGVITALVFGAIYIRDHLKDRKEILKSLGIIVVAALLVAVVALITQYLLIPIGEQAKEALYGAGIVIGIIAIMALIVNETGKINKKDAIQGGLVIAAIEVLVALMALITTEYIIPVGERGDEALYGGAVIVGTLACMALLVALAGKIPADDAIKGGLIIAGIGVLLAALGELMPGWIDVCTKAYENMEAMALGGLAIVATLVVFGVLMGVIGALASSIGPYLLIGGVILIGIGAVIALIAVMMDPWIDVCVKALNEAEAMALGGLIIVATLVTFGLIMAGIGALTFVLPFIAIGGAILSGIALTLGLISLTFPPYIDLCQKVNETPGIMKASGQIIALIGMFGAVIAALGLLTLIPFIGIGVAAGTVLLGEIAAAMVAIEIAMNAYAGVIKAFMDTNPNDRNKFEKYMTDTKNGFVGSMNRIIDGLNEIGERSAKEAAHIAFNLRPIFTVIKDFMKIIESFGQLKIVTEWDKDGKPIAYQQMTPKMFKDAANAVTSSFATFLEQLGKAMKSWDAKSIFVMQLMGDSIGPVMNSIGAFVEGICKFISFDIPDEFDEDGKPTHFRKVNPIEFEMAAIAISHSFGTFLVALGEGLQALPFTASQAINSLKEGIEPTMNAVATYVNAILALTVGSIIELDELDANGKPTGKSIKKLIEFNPDKFKEAAVNISDCFITFIKTLMDYASQYDYRDEVVTESNTFSADETQVTRGNKMGDFLTSLGVITSIVEGITNLADYLITKGTEINDKSADLKLAATNLAGFVTSTLNSLKYTMGLEDSTWIETISKNMAFVKTITDTFKNIYESSGDMIKNSDAFNQIGKIILGFIGFFNDKNTLKVFDDAKLNIDSAINPIITKILDLYMWFDKFEYESNSIFGKTTSKLDVKSALKNVNILVNIIKEFANALTLYNDAPKELSFDVISTIGATITLMYLDVENSYDKYHKSFAGISKKYTLDVNKTVIPTFKNIISTGLILKNVFKQLDDALLKQEDKRNKALKKLTEHIKDMSNVTKELADNLKAAESSAMSTASRMADYTAVKSSSESAAASSNTSTSSNGSIFDKLTGKSKKEAEPEVTPEDKKMEEMFQRLSLQVALIVAALIQQVFSAERPFVVSFDNQGAKIGKMTIG